MNRLSPRDFEPRATNLELEHIAGSRRPGAATGLVITCAAHCFPTAAQARTLVPEAWLVHRTPGNIVPPFGTGHDAEEEILEQAIDELHIDTLVVCGHHPCSIAAHLLTPDGSTDDFLLHDWLCHAAAARRSVLRWTGQDGVRAAAAHNVLAQLTNLRTHPPVAAALAASRLKLWGWLHAGELLCPGPVPTCFNRPVALQPDQNRCVRRGSQASCSRPALPRLNPPYLA